MFVVCVGSKAQSIERQLLDAAQLGSNTTHHKLSSGGQGLDFIFGFHWVVGGAQFCP
jgi:hypothetical protein